jgi:hypothetical protein
MEEAASLFGPADFASDPFGSIVTNGGDDLTASSTSPPSELPHPDTREADTGGNWYDDASSHYQVEGSLHPEYDWRNSDGTGHFSDNFQPQYEGSTPSNFTDSHPINPYMGDNLQHTASLDGEWPPPSRGFGLTTCVNQSWSCLWDAAELRVECCTIRTVLYSATSRRFVRRPYVICFTCACSPRAVCDIRAIQTCITTLIQQQ